MIGGSGGATVASLREEVDQADGEAMRYWLNMSQPLDVSSCLSPLANVRY
jgi:hypothetical protein